MLEAVVIIIALGGLEAVLWALDHRQQKKQIELLDSIWAELAIRNSAEKERERAVRPVEGEHFSALPSSRQIQSPNRRAG